MTRLDKVRYALLTAGTFVAALLLAVIYYLVLPAGFVGEACRRGWIIGMGIGRLIMNGWRPRLR